MRKNPENKPLRIIRKKDDGCYASFTSDADYSLMLSNLAIAEAQLVAAGKDSALPHFLAIVKELERLHGFTFEIADD